MNHRIVSAMLLGWLGMGLAACASHPPPSVANLPGKESCFWTRTVFTWTVLDDSTLIVDAPMNTPYLVKLLSPIPQLRFLERIGFDNGPSAIGQFCSTTGYIVARGQFAQRSPATAVRALSPQQAKQLIAAAKSPQPHQQAAAKPPSPPAG
jgi:hypothetical protein